MADNCENSETIPENSQQLALHEGPDEPAPKKRGRPVGARDKAPRKPRTVIVEHAYEHPPAPQPTLQPTPQEAKQAEPQSPKSLFKQATEHLAAFHAEREKARRAYWADTIAKSLR
jgi:hypothetical protein